MGILTPLTQESTSVLVAQKLREKIIDGHFAPGQQINETLVSSQLNLSRGPLREALQRLSQEGLLVNKPNRGVFVVELTAHDVEEIYHLRELLELGAAEIITNQQAGERKRVSRKLLKVATKLTDAADSEDWLGVSKLDLQFHTTLVSESGNSRLLRTYTTLATESLICMTNFEKAYPTQSSVTHHLVLAELIATGSMPEIRAELHQHLSL
ncbi:GntR family transcriptional regulator [Paenarthrobacter nicotinovorans]|uniref:GntR family transcriptional regulator n=1 Tax=Paenarthrobacter nicotinovorans TaxID=29320 RepID=UPI003A806BE0